MRRSAAHEPRSDTVHFFDSTTGDYIESRAPDFFIRMQGRHHCVRLPLPAKLAPFAGPRLARRSMRIDKANAVFVDDRTAVVFLYQGRIYRWSPDMAAPEQTGRLEQCRNVLHQSIAVLGGREIYFGEYGSNPERGPVPIWGSLDGGRTWEVVHQFPAGAIRHVHGVYADPFSDDVWITTGDFENECFLYRADRRFQRVERIGDGSQAWRTVALLFEKDRISWVMDSQLERSHLHHLDRRSGALTRGRGFPGPVWYAKTLEDGVTLVQTTREIGAGVETNAAHLFASRDNEAWTEVAVFAKDALPMRYFKFGILSFADGPQTSDRFAMFGEGLRGFDGQAGLFALEWR